MKTEIEGDWKDYTIRFVKLSDIPNILEFYAKHARDPLYHLSGPDETYPEYSKKKIAKLMELEEVCDLSLIALHKMTGEIAGIHLQFIWTKEAAYNPQTNTDEIIPPFRKIMNILHAHLSDTKLGMFIKYDVESVVWNFMIAVNSKYRNNGLASEMFKRIVVLLKKKKFPLAFSIFTNPFSRRCAQKVGYMEIDIVYFNELRDEEGEYVVPNGGKDDFASVMVLQM